MLTSLKTCPVVMNSARVVMILSVLMLPSCASVAPGQLDSFEIVDCELPGQTIRIGSGYATTGRARAVRTSATDCAIRGGYFAEADQANYQTALKVWLGPAEAGDVAAQLYLGQIYEKGLGQAPDMAAALRWYQRAAEANHAPAQAALAMLYEKGLVTGKPEPQKALELYRKAAKLEDQLRFQSELTVLEADVSKLTRALESSKLENETLRNRLRQETQSLLQQIESLQGAVNRAVAAREPRIESEARSALQRVQTQQQDKQQQLTALEASLVLGKQMLSNLRLANPADAPTQIATVAPVATQATAVMATSIPKIELLQPRSMSMRGLLAVPVSSETGMVQVSARITSAEPIDSVRINGALISLDAQGIARANIQTETATTMVEIVAFNQAGRSAKLPFVLTQDVQLSQAIASTDATPAAQKALLPAPQNFGRYHALVIGNDQYQDWEALDTPRADAQAVAGLLREQYGFDVTLLINAKRADVFRALNTLRQKLGEQDNLLVYYSGHGSWDSANQRGYWIPVDGGKDDISNYISSADITDQLSVMAARQVLVVADACYAGVLVGSVSDQILAGNSRESMLQGLAQPKSRKVISSGNIRQVLDGGAGAHSIFAFQFLQSLRERHSAFPARELYQEIAPKVAQAAAGFGEEQEPQYGQLRWAGHVAGDFIFVPKS